MKKFLCAIVLSAFSMLSASYGALDMSDPYVLAEQAASVSLAKIKTAGGDREKLRNIIENDLLPYVDVKYAAYKVMGAAAKNLTKEERELFSKEFALYMENSFIDVLSKYTTQEIVLAPHKDLSDNEDLVAVKMAITEPGKKDLELILKMRKNKKTGEWKAFDLVGENISILDAKTSELYPVISTKGINAAIALLKSKEVK